MRNMGRIERHTEKRGEGRMSCDQALDRDKDYRQVSEGTRQEVQQGLSRT